MFSRAVGFHGMAAILDFMALDRQGQYKFKTTSSSAVKSCTHI